VPGAHHNDIINTANVEYAQKLERWLNSLPAPEVAALLSDGNDKEVLGSHVED
jgi:hypothetical protein